MKKSSLILIWLNVLIGIIILVVFYLSAFLSGYGSNATHLPQEKRLFVEFVFFHFVVNIYLLYRLKQIKATGIIISMSVIILLYLLAAWQFGYF
jgi:hypothetical protein